ncbi:MAG TPA: hypothetical protein VGR16_03145 [Thermomicrobiales bacterium]|nr:hypothetical protein [Thermomicrobiales bacterium]
MPPILRLRDRWGREIVLTEEIWFDHVLPGHRELAAHLSAVERTIVDADQVNRDAGASNRENFYLMGALPDPYQHLYLKVCVQFQRSAADAIIGRVVTAFPARKIKASEVKRWP